MFHIQILFLSLVISTSVLATSSVKYDPIFKKSLNSMAAFKQHYLGYMSYTLNQMTPGVKHVWVANYLDENNEIQTQKYYPLNQGPPIETGRYLDFLIQGNGFLVLRISDTLGYTRDGRLDIDENRYLVSKNGYFIQGQNGPIQLPKEHSFLIAHNGAVMVGGTQIDQIKIIDFIDATQIESKDESIFFTPLTNVKEIKSPAYYLRNGFYEGPSIEKGRLWAYTFKHAYLSSTSVLKNSTKAIKSGISVAK